MRVHEFVDEGLGHSSYVIDLGDGAAAVVDPPRFPTAQEALADRLGLRIAWTLDTHSTLTTSPAAPRSQHAGARRSSLRKRRISPRPIDRFTIVARCQSRRSVVAAAIRRSRISRSATDTCTPTGLVIHPSNHSHVICASLP